MYSNEYELKYHKVMSYINNDYYYDQISALANELMDEVADVMSDHKDNEIILNDGLPLNFNNKKLVKLIYEENDYNDTDIALYYEDGETELFRELDIYDMMIITEWINRL